MAKAFAASTGASAPRWLTVTARPREVKAAKVVPKARRAVVAKAFAASTGASAPRWLTADASTAHRREAKDVTKDVTKDRRAVMAKACGANTAKSLIAAASTGIEAAGMKARLIRLDPSISAPRLASIMGEVVR